MKSNDSERRLTFTRTVEFGSELLEKNQAYEAEREGLEQRLEAREAEINYLHEQLERSQQSNETLRLQITVMNCHRPTPHPPLLFITCARK